MLHMSCRAIGAGLSRQAEDASLPSPAIRRGASCRVRVPPTPGVTLQSSCATGAGFTHRLPYPAEVERHGLRMELRRSLTLPYSAATAAASGGMA